MKYLKDNKGQDNGGVLQGRTWYRILPDRTGDEGVMLREFLQITEEILDNLYFCSQQKGWKPDDENFFKVLEKSRGVKDTLLAEYIKKSLRVKRVANSMEYPLIYDSASKGYKKVTKLGSNKKEYLVLPALELNSPPILKECFEITWEIGQYLVDKKGPIVLEEDVIQATKEVLKRREAPTKLLEGLVIMKEIKALAIEGDEYAKIIYEKAKNNIKRNEIYGDLFSETGQDE